MTTKQFADEVDAPYTTVMGWLRDGRIPEAEFDDSHPRGRIWYIPRSAVARFKNPETKPRKGRPPKQERPKAKKPRSAKKGAS
ncbi:MAG: helix-turn-helix domain-containing protein [Blastocatellia bacterium]|nr:helix-turn-helix domain-containing protein [Blastocatellia bacterium]